MLSSLMFLPYHLEVLRQSKASGAALLLKVPASFTNLFTVETTIPSVKIRVVH
jgi:hypothetical protein